MRMSGRRQPRTGVMLQRPAENSDSCGFPFPWQTMSCIQKERGRVKFSNEIPLVNWMSYWKFKNFQFEFQKNIYFSFIDYAKAFDCVDHNKLWKILREMGIPDHMTCLSRNLYAGQKAAVRTGHGTRCPNRKRSTSRLSIVTLLI